MSQQGTTIISLLGEDQREWYEDDTKIISPAGILLATVIGINQSTVEATTKIINADGTLLSTTEDI